jgi:hypothetical protein
VLAHSTLRFAPGEQRSLAISALRAPFHGARPLVGASSLEEDRLHAPARG